MLSVVSPFPQYFDNDGSPLDGGYVFVGAVGQNAETNPLTVYWDAAGTQPAAQPIRTINGFLSRPGTIAQLYVAEEFSLTIRNKRRELVATTKNGALGSVVSALLGDGTQAGAQKALGIVVVDRAYNAQLGYNILAPTIPYDATVPQSNEGTQIHQGSITPKSITNRIRVRVHCPFGSTWIGSDAGTLAVFINGGTIATRAVTNLVADAQMNVLYLEFEYQPGTLDTQNVVVRVGCNAGAFIVGGSRSVPNTLGGAMLSSFVMEELTA